MEQNDKAYGFTLVELAIALMVIGLLIGGVLKGQELIENAKVTAFMRQFGAYDTAIMVFRNTYGVLPGDIKRPNRIPNCNTDDDSICGISGNGNGKIRFTDTNPQYIEEYNFFPHLTKAGMIQGLEGGTVAEMSAATANPWQAPEHDLFFPEIPIGSKLLFDGGVFYVSMTTAQMSRIDAKMDDGLPRARGGNIYSEDCNIKQENGRWVYDLEADDFDCTTWMSNQSLIFKGIDPAANPGWWD